MIAYIKIYIKVEFDDGRTAYSEFGCDFGIMPTIGLVDAVLKMNEEYYSQEFDIDVKVITISKEEYDENSGDDIRLKAGWKGDGPIEIYD